MRTLPKVHEEVGGRLAALDVDKRPKVSSVVERFVKQLNMTLKAVRLYPPSSSMPRDSAVAAVSTLRTYLQSAPEMRLTVMKNGLMHGQETVWAGHPAFEAFAREFYSRGVASVRFHAGVTATELVEFLRVLDAPADELSGSSEFESRLWEANVVSITTSMASARIVDSAGLDDPEDAEADRLPERARIDELIAGALGGRPRDQRVLVRILKDLDALGSYLQESLADRGSTPTEIWLASRIAALAHATQNDDPEERATRSKALADALRMLDPETRAAVVGDRLLADARHDEMMAEIVQDLSLDEICGLIASRSGDSATSRDGLSRDLRNLVLVRAEDREEIMESASRALADAGSERDTIEEILSGALPTRVELPDEAPSDQRDNPMETILKLMDMVPGTVDTGLDIDADLLAEAARGIDDGDVLRALVTLVFLERRERPFGSIMGLIEDNLAILIDRQDFSLAEGVVSLLSSVARSKDRSDVQRERAESAVRILLSKKSMRSISAAMRWYPKESDGYASSHRLLKALGEHDVGPLLEALADEPDRATRKILVGLASGLVDLHLDELGRCLKDKRWYFVRNVVTILGASRRPEAVALYERTLRYPDARVRRETIRSVAALKGARSGSLLVAALSDEDAQNVQLAVRYLAASGVRQAADALEQVARGEGRGNRDIGPRIEAIEALGELGVEGSAVVLQKLAHVRSFTGRAKIREIKTAASTALERLHNAGEGGEGVER